MSDCPSTARKDGPILRLLLGDQLNPNHSWFSQIRHDVVYVMMEVRSETDYVRHHAQKVLALFAAMRDFARQLEERGHRVRYLAIDDAANQQDLARNLDVLVAEYRATSVEYQEPDEWRVDQRLLHWTRHCAVPVSLHGSEHFYTGRTEASAFFGGRPRWVMEGFYRHQRRKHGVLMTEDGQPAGGRWNFDESNRKPWRGAPAAPRDSRPVHDHSRLWQTIRESGIDTMGDPQAGSLRWPLNRTEALLQLDHFIEEGLASFGDFQDALSSSEWRLFHSLLSFALNTKMINPREAVDRAQEAWKSGLVPLHAAEGFIRQILGWREYVRGVYWARMPGYTQVNSLEHHRPLPGWFWSGETRMACVSAAIRQSLREAYAHHIQRLMVIGNFSLLAGLDPAELHRWYLGIYIDAFEWVEAPNTLGMSQFADGGQLATKPYISSSAYLSRMGDHCSHCHYSPKERTSERACPFNALYWYFLEREAGRLDRNPRLAVAYRQLSRMSTEARDGLRRRAEGCLDAIESL